MKLQYQLLRRLGTLTFVQLRAIDILVHLDCILWIVQVGSWKTVNQQSGVPSWRSFLSLSFLLPRLTLLVGTQALWLQIGFSTSTLVLCFAKFRVEIAILNEYSLLFGGRNCELNCDCAKIWFLHFRVLCRVASSVMWHSFLVMHVLYPFCLRVSLCLSVSVLRRRIYLRLINTVEFCSVDIPLCHSWR